MSRRLLRIGKTLLKLFTGIALVLVLGAALVILSGRRDAPAPDLSGLELPPRGEVPANSNAFYFIREAVQYVWIPVRTTRVESAWIEANTNLAGMRAILASNRLALAWAERAAACRQIAPPRAYVAQDASFIGWSPVTVCGSLLRLRADLALAEGHPHDALRGYEASLWLARLNLDNPPVQATDALAAFAELRNALSALRGAASRLGTRTVWERQRAALAELSDLREVRRRLSASLYAVDRAEIAQLQRIVAGAEPPPLYWDSPMACLLPDAQTLAEENWSTRALFETLNRLPASYRLHPNRTLSMLANVRRGGPMPAAVREANAVRNSGTWMSLGQPACRFLGPNGLGEFYAVAQAERQVFIENGTQIAECAARGTRLALALRLYELERGELPAQLDALSPEWLDRVPTDPYAGQPFRYDRSRRLLYAIGPNRRDDGGRGGDVLFPVD